MPPDLEAKPAPKGDGAPDEIEVTPEMIEAGARLLCGYETLTRDEAHWAEEVYRAMRRAAPR
jgi:hypothetical protein